MERWANQYRQLDARSHFNRTLNTSVARDEPWQVQNQTKAVIASLQLASIQTLRTTHVTLGVFSLVLVLLMVHRIVADARRVAAVQVTLRKPFLQGIHPAETFPLVLACGAVIQQIVFIAVQSTNLHSIWSLNCRGLAMVTFPAIFLAGYITLVFGIEMVMRAFKQEQFAPRGRNNTPICLGIIASMLLFTWLPTVIWPTGKVCFGSLIWFPVRYELLAIIFLSILVSAFLTLAALLSIQLMRASNIDPNERIAASRMSYYLLISALLYALVMPIEIQAHRRDFLRAFATSRIAETALFTSGIVFAFFHLFLRANANRLVISSTKSGSTGTKQKRPRIRFFGPSDLEMNISGPLALQGGPRPDSRQGLIDIGAEKNRYEFDAQYFTPRVERPLTPGSMYSNGPVDPEKWPLPPPVDITSNENKENTSGVHKRTKSSYSLFPTRAEDIPRLPATVYTPPAAGGENTMSNLALRRQTRRSSLGDTKSVTDVSEAFGFLAKPRPLFAGRHRREESTASSATVQIGLRFSVAPAILPAAKYTPMEPAVPPLHRDYSDSTIETLGLPIQVPSTVPSSTTPSSEDINAVAFPQPPQTTSPKGLGKTPAFPISAQTSGKQNDKVLPPTPHSSFPGPPPSVMPPPPARTPGMSGLRMNPVSPATMTPGSPPRSATTTRSPTVPSPTARIPLGAGTMARSPPPNGWI